MFSPERQSDAWLATGYALAVVALLDLAASLVFRLAVLPDGTSLHLALQTAVTAIGLFPQLLLLAAMLAFRHALHDGEHQRFVGPIVCVAFAVLIALANVYHAIDPLGIVPGFTSDASDYAAAILAATATIAVAVLTVWLLPRRSRVVVTVPPLDPAS